MVDVCVCIGTSCHLKGSYNVIQTFQQLIEERKLHDRVNMRPQFCMNQCRRGVSVQVDGEVFGVSPDGAKGFFETTVLARVATGLSQ
ncbi:MAG: (2Fe-2S) ferredoxin domain-containing protein [Christensenellaceae bacterium]|nr:(2Fe-2S) ferredoxin domain-containing protein [Christensenellaceae bacterium]MEA5065022.1 (2Fe-2S) ferredoxin domain-containing protein [Eubacteriales bacterium]MEA5068253.1 (2Fe-2S) ferredoxin domain-containing protein [Christensenellaceae bacterium]